MAQVLGKIRSLWFYRWPLLPSIFSQLRLIRAGNSQTAWIIKNVKWNLFIWRCTTVTTDIPRCVLDEGGAGRLLIGSEWEVRFLLFSKIITNCRVWGGGIISTAFYMKQILILYIKLYHAGDSWKVYTLRLIFHYTCQAGRTYTFIIFISFFHRSTGINNKMNDSWIPVGCCGFRFLVFCVPGIWLVRK